MKHAYNVSIQTCAGSVGRLQGILSAALVAHGLVVGCSRRRGFHTHLTANWTLCSININPPAQQVTTTLLQKGKWQAKGKVFLPKRQGLRGRSWSFSATISHMPFCDVDHAGPIYHRYYAYTHGTDDHEIFRINLNQIKTDIVYCLFYDP